MSQYTALTPLADGSLDPAFNGDGKKVLAFPNAKSTSGQCIAEGPDGRIYVGGGVDADSGGIHKLGVACLHKNGTPVTEFGKDGYVVVPFGPMQDTHLRQILFLTVGGETIILLSGIDTIKGEVVLACLHLDGRLFERFGVKGLLTINQPANLAKSLGLGATPLTTTSIDASGPCTVADGKIYVVMEMYMPIWIATVALLICLNVDGSYDTTFNNIGYVAVTNQYWGNSSITDVVVHNGKITVCGTLNDKGMVARLNNDGTFVETFADKGFKLFGSSVLALEKLTLYSENSVLAAGWGMPTRQGVLACLNDKGELEPKFNGGKVLFQSFEEYSNVLFKGVGQFDEKIIVAGRMGETGGYPLFVVACYKSSGALDIGFNGTGWNATRFEQYFSVANSMAVQEDGNILVVGDSGSLSSAALIARFLNTTPSVAPTA